MSPAVSLCTASWKFNSFKFQQLPSSEIILEDNSNLNNPHFNPYKGLHQLAELKTTEVQKRPTNTQQKSNIAKQIFNVRSHPQTSNAWTKSARV